MSETLTTITSLVAILAAVTSFLIAWRKSKPEIQQVQSDAVEHYATAAKHTAEMYSALLKQYNDLSCEIKLLRDTLRDTTDKLEQATTRIAVLEEQLLRTRKEAADQASSLKLELDLAQDQIKRLTKRLADWQRGITTLINQLVKIGHVPEWTPDNSEYME